MRSSSWWCVIVLGACGDSAKPAADAPVQHAIDAAADAAVFLDAPPPDLSCAGQALPTTAPDPVQITGTTALITILGLVPEAGVTLGAFVDGDVTARASVTSDAQGMFAFDVPSGGAANVGYLLATKDGLLPTYLYAATPVYQNLLGTTDVIVDAGLRDQLASSAGVAQDAGNGILSVRFIDCGGQPLAGGHLTSPAGAVYAAQGRPDVTATATDGGGVAYVFNVPPGDVTIAGTLGATTMRSHVVAAFAGSPTFTDLQP